MIYFYFKQINKQVKYNLGIKSYPVYEEKPKQAVKIGRIEQQDCWLISVAPPAEERTQLIQNHHALVVLLEWSFFSNNKNIQSITVLY